jgi:hypothetical protein
MIPVFICGKGPSMADFNRTYSAVREKNPITEVWTLNDMRLSCATLHFEIHSPRHHRDISKIDTSIRHVCHWDEEPRFKNEYRYPIEWVESRVPDAIDRLSSTVAYELAYLTCVPPATIYMMGCDYITDEWRTKDVLFWIGYLRGRGCTFVIPEISKLNGLGLYK